MNSKDRLLELGKFITGLEPDYRVTYELHWIEIRTEGNPSHVKVTDEEGLFVIGWYLNDDADMEDAWDGATYSHVMEALDNLFD